MLTTAAIWSLIMSPVASSADALWKVSEGKSLIVEARAASGAYRATPSESVRAGEPLFLGYPHGPKTAEFVPPGRLATTRSCALSSDGVGEVRFEVRAGEDSFPCRTGEVDVVRSALGSPSSGLDRGVYDRAADRLFEVEGAESLLIQRTSSGWALTARGKSLRAVLKPRYYRDHLSYFLYEPTNKLWREPMAGWCSWAAYGQGVSEKQMLEAADFFSKNLRDYGYTVIQMDDGFQRVPQMGEKGPTTAERIADLWSKPIPEKFPSGLGSLAAQIKAMGLTPGIWIGMYLPMKEGYLGYVLGKDGKPFRGPWVNYAADGFDEKAVREGYLESILTLKKQGWDYFKLDTLRHILYDNYRLCPDYFAGKQEDLNEAYRKLIAQFREAVGKDTYFLACWGTIPELAGLPDGCRIGEDVGPSWRSIELVGKYVAQFQYLNNVVWRNDPDYMCFRASVENCRFWASLLALAGVQLMVSDPIEAYDAERVDFLRRVGPPLVSRPRALSPQGEGKELWSLDIEKGGEQWTVLGRFAWKDLATRQLSLSEIGLDPGKGYLAFDFWGSRFLGRVKGSLALPELKQGNCFVVGLREMTGHPQVLGTDRHIGQGAVELNDVKWKDLVLSGTFRLAPGKGWSLYVYVPEGFSLESAKGDGWSTSQGGDVVRVKFRDGSGDRRFRLSFKSK